MITFSDIKARTISGGALRNTLNCCAARTSVDRGGDRDPTKSEHRHQLRTRPPPRSIQAESASSQQRASRHASAVEGVHGSTSSMSAGSSSSPCFTYALARGCHTGVSTTSSSVPKERLHRRHPARTSGRQGRAGRAGARARGRAGAGDDCRGPEQSGRAVCEGPERERKRPASPASISRAITSRPGDVTIGARSARRCLRSLAIRPRG